MKKRFCLFLVLLVVIILSLTSCDDIISKIPGIGEKPNAEPEIYTITYVIVYGERTESAQVKRGDTIPKPEDPEREGYIFTGWYANQALTEEINFNSVPLGSFMIFAGWEPIMHTADFDIDGYDQSVAYDAFVQRPEVLPQKDGYYFVDWYADPEYTVLFDFGAPIKGDVKIYAKWHPITYLAEFIVYDENDNPSIYHSITVNYGTAVDAPANPEDRDSGNFLYWRDQNGVAWNFSTPLYDNIVLTAVYSLNRYTIYLANTNMAPIEYNHGDILQGLNEPWKDGFVFDGWYADEELTVKWQFGTPITSDTTIYAKWV